MCQSARVSTRVLRAPGPPGSTTLVIFLLISKRRPVALADCGVYCCALGYSWDTRAPVTFKWCLLSHPSEPRGARGRSRGRARRGVAARPRRLGRVVAEAARRRRLVRRDLRAPDALRNDVAVQLHRRREARAVVDEARVRGRVPACGARDVRRGFFASASRRRRLCGAASPRRRRLRDATSLRRGVAAAATSPRRRGRQ